MANRYYQDECLQASVDFYLAGIRQQLAVLATGTGKTYIFSQTPSRYADILPGKTLVTVHREELVDQAIAHMQKYNPDLKVGKEMAQYRADNDCDILVTCVASIGREGATRMERFDWNSITKVICDEAHHSIASTYLKVFTDAGVLLPDTHKLLLGVTATPKRKNLNRKTKAVTLDEDEILSLKSVYKKIIYTYPIRKAIKDGWLVPVKGFKLKTDTDLSEIKSTAGDYAQGQLADTVNTPERNIQIVKAWKEHGEERPTIVFTVDIAHAQDLAKAFVEQGVDAQALWGSDPDRASKLENFKAGRLKLLTNCAVLTEGFDAWQVGCVVLARPTKSSSLFTQMVGRGTRLQEGTGNLLEALAAGFALTKKDCYILDVVDNNKRCSLVTFPSLLGLNPDMDLAGASIVEAVETLEEAQDKYPGVDFSKLTDISKIKAYVESLDMFAEPYTEEVKEFSELTWMATADNNYVLSIPERKELSDAKAYPQYLHEKLHIKTNELEEFELHISTVKDERKLGTFGSLKEAFVTADDVIKRCRPDRMKLITREAAWHKHPASEPVKKYLKRLGKKKNIPWCLCPGSKPAGSCDTCGMKTGLTAGLASQALNLLKA